MKLKGLLILCAGILLSGPVFTQDNLRADLPPGLSILNVKWDSFATLTTVSSGALAETPDTNPNRLPLPTQSTSTLVRTQLYVYSFELNNDGPKAIKALAWDFIFTDGATGRELLRYRLAKLQGIATRRKKTVRFTTRLSPPKVVSARALEKSGSSPFRPTVALQCVLFADDSTWQAPLASDPPCNTLRRWLERRKKQPAGGEDLPLAP